jgi:hypothetical protein
MKKILITVLLGCGLLINHNLSSQTSPLLELEFSNSITNIGTSNVVLPNTVYNYTTDRKGFANCAIVLDKQSISVGVENDLIIENNKSYSFSTWFKIKNNGFQQDFISSTGYYLGIGQGSLVGFGINAQSLLKDYYNSADTLTKWYHLVVTLSNDSAKVFLDNKLMSQNKRYSTSSTSNSLTLFNRFTGVVDNFLIFGKELTQNEVSILFNSKSICDVPTSIESQQSAIEKILIKTYNLQGQEIENNAKGAQIRVFSDGSREKVFIE